MLKSTFQIDIWLIEHETLKVRTSASSAGSPICQTDLNTLACLVYEDVYLDEAADMSGSKGADGNQAAESQISIQYLAGHETGCESDEESWQPVPSKYVVEFISLASGQRSSVVMGDWCQTDPHWLPDSEHIAVSRISTGFAEQRPDDHQLQFKVYAHSTLSLVRAFTVE